jgi:putative peptide zinc metalloprotease protein
MTEARLLDQRLERRADVILGPAVLRGAAPVHLIKDSGTQRCYEVGAKEYFIISRLDGQHTLGEIGEAYTERFNRPLGERSWYQLLALLAERNLLTERKPLAERNPRTGPGPDARPLPAEQPNTGRRPRGRIVFGNPAALIASWHRRLRWMFRAQVLWPVAGLIVAMEGVLAFSLPELSQQLRMLYQRPELDVLVVALLWIGGGLHEFGHGLTAKHFGGNATEMGIRLSLPVLLLYCRVEDTRLFRSRWQRVATALAGPVVNLLVLLPFLPLWLLLPADAELRSAVGALLLLGSVQALANLVPIPPLDGYAILGHALNMTDLGTQSRQYFRLLARAAIRRGTGPSDYPRWTAVVYLGYAAFLVVAVSAVCVGSVWLCIAVLPRPYGVLSAAALLMIWIARAVGGKTWRSSTAPAQE